LPSTRHRSPHVKQAQRCPLTGMFFLAFVCTYGVKTLAAPTILCNSDETVVFSCSVSGGKVVSLCASPGLTKVTGYLQYRFGNGASIELEYPQRQMSPASAFKYFQGYGAKGGTTAVSFTVNAYRYSVFRTTSAFGYNGAGVIIAKAEKRVALLKCDAKTVITPADLFYRLSPMGIPEAQGDINYIGAEQP
jgi:hypothetical protein